MRHQARITLCKGKVRIQCSCGEQSDNLRITPGAFVALRVWRTAHRRVA